MHSVLVKKWNEQSGHKINLRRFFFWRRTRETCEGFTCALAIYLVSLMFVLFCFFFRTLALIHSPPVSYTMPFPHQAMVRVADIGVWLNTTKAGGFTAAFPTPYNPKGNINQEKRVWINCQQELITISYCSMKWLGVLLLQLKCSWDGMLVFALVPSPPIFSEVPWQFMSTQLYSWSGKKNCPLGNRKTPRVRLKPRLFNPECSALILRLPKILWLQVM